MEDSTLLCIPKDILKKIGKCLMFIDKLAFRHTCSLLYRVIQITYLPPKYSNFITARAFPLKYLYPPLTLSGSEISSITTLHSLQLSYVPLGLDLSHMPHLKKLIVYDGSSRGVKFADTSHLSFITGLTQLRKLDLRFKFVVDLCALTNLHSLSIDALDTDAIHNDIIGGNNHNNTSSHSIDKYISNLTQLKFLYCDNISQECLKRFTNLQAASIRRQTSYANIPNLQFISTRCITDYHPSLHTSLRMLQLFKHSDIVFEKFQGLYDLFVCWEIPVETLLWIPTLRRLTMRNVTVAPQSSQLTQLTQLTQLKLTRCEHDQRVFLDIGKFPRIACVVLEGIVPKISHQCMSLQCLEIYYTYVSGVLRYTPNLTALVIKKCVLSTVPSELKYVPKLKTLKYDGKLLESGLQYLTELVTLEAPYTESISGVIKNLRYLTKTTLVKCKKNKR